MGDLDLQYRACGAECRDDFLRMLADDNGLPLATVRRAADAFGEAETFGRLLDYCESAAETVQ